MHELIAGVALKSLQALAQKNNVNLSVGDITVEELTPVAVLPEGEGPQPLEVASRLVAHIGHRIPGIKKVEKRLEGKELKAGILSDLASLGAQLYARNKGQIDDMAAQVVATKVSNFTGAQGQPIPGGGVFRDFGVVGPENNNDNGGSDNA